VPGLFIVLEGIEGSGKTTQARLLVEWLRRRDVPATHFREPGGVAVAEGIRELLLRGVDMPARTELLLMLAARAALVDTGIAPALAEGRVVVADRFDLSTLAYQVYGRRLPDGEVRRLNAFATAGLRPDLTLVLDVTPAEAERRREAAGSTPDRIERAGSDFHGRVAEAYHLLSETEPGVERVSADGTRDSVHAEIVRRVVARFPETFPPGTVL
jgi:dTMP kinase